MITIRELRYTDRNDWESFVRADTEARICHSIGYKDFIEDVFGYTPVYWVLEKDKVLTGVFPSFEFSNAVGQRFWISQPFIEYGGPLVRNLSHADWSALISRIEYKLVTDRIASMKMNGFCPDTALLYRKKFCQSGYLELNHPRDVWHRRLSPQAKKAVRKALNNNLICTLSRGEDSVRREFYPLYLDSMKRLGSPPFSLKYFTAKMSYFKDAAKLFVVRTSCGRCIAALMGFAFGSRMFIEFSVNCGEMLDVRPNDLAHWKCIEWACDNGYRYFDFGTIRYSGQKQFKEKWGIKIADNYNAYVFHPHRKKRHFYAESNNTDLRLMSRLWSLCMPAFIARRVGQTLHRQLFK